MTSIQKIKHDLFSFQGRIGRLTFVGYSLGFYFFLVSVGLGFYFGLSFIDRSLGAIIAGLIFVVGIIAYIWAGLALMIKRLHDLNRSGYNAIWIYGIFLLNAFAEKTSTALLLLTSIVSLAVMGWLLLARGDSIENVFGQPPGRTV